MLILTVLQFEQEELKLQHHCTENPNLGNAAPHTCQEVCSPPACGACISFAWPCFTCYFCFKEVLHLFSRASDASKNQVARSFYLGCLLLHCEGSFCMVMSIRMLSCFRLSTNDITLRGQSAASTDLSRLFCTGKTCPACTYLMMMMMLQSIDIVLASIAAWLCLKTSQ